MENNSKGPGRGPGKKKSRDKAKGGNFVVQGSILAAAGIIVRLIGLVYRV